MDVGKDSSIAFVGSYAHSPLELYYMSAPGAPPRQLTRFNESVAALSLGKVQAIQWQGPDGWRENGIFDLSSRLCAGEEISARAAHPRWTPVGFNRGV